MTDDEKQASHEYAQAQQKQDNERAEAKLAARHQYKAQERQFLVDAGLMDEDGNRVDAP